MLKAVGLTKRYGSIKALDRLDLEIQPGETAALLGANGAGKTTTIKLLLGLATPTAGSVRVCGSSPRDPEVRRRLGYSPESPRFHEFLSVAETLDVYAELSAIPRRLRPAAIDRVLEQTGLAELRTRKLRTLSKGEAQRLSVAQALLGEPDVLVLDEPTSGLDPLGRVAMRRLLTQCRERGQTILLSSHILTDVERLCARAFILRRGRLAWSGSIESTNGSLEDLFVDVNRA